MVIIGYMLVQGAPSLSWESLSSPPRMAGKAGKILPAIVGTFYLMLGTVIFALPVGVFAGICLT